MSVPLFWKNDNLPVGSHFMGRFGDEATLFRLASQLEEAKPCTLFRLASQLEEAKPWADRRPPVSA
jgi:amidase